MDATRISDGKPVMLKRLVNESPYELPINKLLSSEALPLIPRNHCAHLLDVLELPNDSLIMVHPFLRPFYKPPFLRRILHFLCTNLRGERFVVLDDT